METIKEIEVGIGREKDPSTFAKTVIDRSVDKLTDKQSSSISSIGQAKCVLSHTTSDCISEPDNECLESNNKVKTTFYNFKFTMLLQYSKECLGFIALILTTYATLLNKEPVIGGTTSPKPIFSLHSIVQEWPYGNLVDVQSKVAVSELSLIYFYAPWCAESLHAKKVYNSVANLYSEEVYFAAVNCWQPNSACRTLYSNVYKWPVLMAYLPNALSVQYNGDWNFHSLSKFIDGLLVPIVRIHNKKELLHLRIANDGVVFGLFNSCDTREFQVFFQSAIKWLENDSYQSTKFAVFVGDETSMFLNSESYGAPVIKLFTPNDTMVYSNSKWSSKNILNFLKKQLSKTSIWVTLPSAKSTTIQKYLQEGPVAMMFSPRISPSNHYFIMKQLIYSYTNYSIDLNNSVLNEYISDIRRDYPLEVKKITNFCDFSKKVHRQGTQMGLFDVNHWGNGFFPMGGQIVNTSKQVSTAYHRRNYADNKNDFGYCQDKFYQKSCFHLQSDNLDYRAPSEILKRHLQKKCVNIEKLPEILFEKGIVEPVDFSEVPKFDHKKNRNLRFLMLDSMVHNEYLRQFVGDLKVLEHSSFPTSKLFIIDNDRETLYMQKTSLSTTTAFEFINEFYNGNLTRHFRSFKQTEVKNKSRDGSIISIKEVNSRQFSKIVNRINVTSVVLFYTPQCPLCYIMSQALLHVSHIINLRNVKFYRIDASANELCWEYTMDKLPKLVVFPKNSSGDSNVFLSSLKVNTKNIFSFILSNLNRDQQLQSVIKACTLTKLSFAFQRCIAQVRGLVSNEIGHQLKIWNHSSAYRPQVLIRLRALREIYIELLRARKTEDLPFTSKLILDYGNMKFID